MKADNSVNKQEKRTFTESARRAQIVNAAIEVLADGGYAQMSFAKIAKQAGLSSTGMISYHFRGKNDLIREVVTQIMRLATEFVTAKLEGEADYAARLRGFFVTNLALLDEYPKHMQALSSIVSDSHLTQGGTFGLAEHLAELARVQEERFRQGQRAGVFRDFDPAVMVMAIRGSLDAATARAATDPHFDTAACARELADLFDLATRRQP